MTILLAVCAAGNAQQSFFNKYGDTKGINTVYISKTMLGMLGKVAMDGTLKTGKGDIGKIAGKLEHLQIMNCERPSMIPAMKQAALDSFKKEGFEQMMNVKDDDENVIIYYKSHGNKLNEFSLLCIEKDELQIINVLGNVTLKEIKELAE